MRRLFGLICLGVVLLAMAGCGPSVSQDDLGELQFEVPKVSGSEKPYKLPEIKAPSSSEGKLKPPKKVE